MRQTSSTSRRSRARISKASDPPTRRASCSPDTFRALGAEPVTINVNGIYDALKDGKVDAQENPLAVNRS